MGHFLSTEFNNARLGVGDFFGGLTGLTGDMGEDKQKWSDYWGHFKGFWTGKEFDDQPTAAQTAAQQLKTMQQLNDPNNAINSRNWKSITTFGSNAAYGGQTNLTGVPKPSDLLSISDPQTKVISSIVRGNNRTNFNIMKNNFDMASSNSLSSSTGGAGASINSAGGQGPEISQDPNIKGIDTSSAQSISTGTSS